jgi:predicted phage terminase large subunit-like protein
VEHSEEVYSEEIREGYFQWFREVVTPLGDRDTSLEIVGTMLHPKALLMDLTRNPTYDSTIYKSIIKFSPEQTLWNDWQEIMCDIDNPFRERDADNFFEMHRERMLVDTEVLWPDNEDYYYLQKLKIEIGKKAFNKEKQNEPVVGDEALFGELHWYKDLGDSFLIEKTGVAIKKVDLIQCIGVIDPAAGEAPPKKQRKGDFSCILIGYRDEMGRLFVSRDRTARDKPSEYIEIIWDMIEKYQPDKFGVETNLYRNLLLPNIIAQRKEREEKRRKTGMRNWGLRARFYDIVNVENKVKRIYALEPKVSMGWILFDKAMSQEFVSQLEAFPLGEHDDGPDALEMLWAMAEGRYDAKAFDGSPYKGR